MDADFVFAYNYAEGGGCASLIDFAELLYIWVPLAFGAGYMIRSMLGHYLMKQKGYEKWEDVPSRGMRETQ